MSAIQINVSRSMNGITYSLTPSIRSLIKRLFPKALPANTIFVAYDVKSDFQKQYGEVSEHIYPALFGVAEGSELKKKIDEVEFVDTATGKVIRSVRP